MTSNPKKRSALGKGLGALLDNPTTDITTTQQTASTNPGGGVSLLPISSIEANPFNPRTNFEKEALQELSDSIDYMELFSRSQYVNSVVINTSLFQVSAVSVLHKWPV